MSLPVPRDADDVTSEWLERMLRRNHGNTYHLTSAEPKSFVANQISYCSEMRVVDCQGQVGSKSLTDRLVVKLLPHDVSTRALVTELRMMQCETNVYKDLLPRLGDFEHSRGQNSVSTMTARCLLAAIEDSGDKDSLRCVIVLENLQHAGFWTPEPLGLPEDALPEAVRQLARFAATSNAWLRSCNIRDLPYLLRTQLPPDHITAQLIRVGVRNVEPGLRQRNRPGLLQKLRRVEGRAPELISAGLQPREPTLRVITHGDYRDGNLLLRRAEGGGTGDGTGGWDLRVVDWQATMMAHPVVDLIYLLMVSVPRDVMKRVEVAALDVYWSEFSSRCGELGSECPLTREELVADFRQAKMLGLMWCLCMVTLWGKQPRWPDHCIDAALEVEELGLLDSL